MCKSIYILLILFTTLSANPLSAKGGVNNEFYRLFKFYKKDAMKNGMLWQKLAIIDKSKDLTPKNRLLLKQMQADLLLQANLPLISATYASDAIKLAPSPTASYNNPAWSILHKVSKLRPIQYILEDLALSIKLGGRYPHDFGNDWNYIIAGALMNKGYPDKAIRFFNRMNMTSRYFMPSKYQMGIAYYEKGDTKKALANLKSILLPSTSENSPLDDGEIYTLKNHANMALGRIYYENKQFLTSARYYRRVEKDSPSYYDALFEQAWSLFMSGNPKHALGSLYGASSPYFEEVYNPEAKVLESTIYFWLCRYDDSRNSLADFAENYVEAIGSIDRYLKGRTLTPKKAYQLFENLVSGVSSESLGIPRKVLNTIATKDSMLLVRDQLATVMSEADRLLKYGVLGSKYQLKIPLTRIMKGKKELQETLGKSLITELQNERNHYERLYSQSQFLYLELLMSEKEQLLGRELHASSKVDEVSDYDDIRGWGLNTQHWKSEKKGEFWWDEIGFHVVDIEPKCVQ